MMVRDLPPEYLREQLDYDPDTGHLYWKRPAQGRRAFPRPVGCLRKDGYILVSIDQRRYFAHRVAYSIFHNVTPDAAIDHINGNPSDNRIANLRLVSFRENLQNKKRHRAGSLPGATRQGDRWFARITVEGKAIHLGTFGSEQEAHEAYCNAQDTLIAEGLISPRLASVHHTQDRRHENERLF